MGGTPLMWAAFNGSKQITKLLLSQSCLTDFIQIKVN